MAAQPTPAQLATANEHLEDLVGNDRFFLSRAGELDAFAADDDRLMLVVGGYEFSPCSLTGEELWSVIDRLKELLSRFRRSELETDELDDPLWEIFGAYLEEEDDRGVRRYEFRPEDARCPTCDATPELSPEFLDNCANEALEIVRQHPGLLQFDMPAYAPELRWASVVKRVVSGRAYLLGACLDCRNPWRATLHFESEVRINVKVRDSRPEIVKWLNLKRIELLPYEQSTPDSHNPDNS